MAQILYTARFPYIRERTCVYSRAHSHVEIHFSLPHVYRVTHDQGPWRSHAM